MVIQILVVLLVPAVQSFVPGFALLVLSIIKFFELAIQSDVEGFAHAIRSGSKELVRVICNPAESGQRSRAHAMSFRWRRMNLNSVFGIKALPASFWMTAGVLPKRSMV